MLNAYVIGLIRTWTPVVIGSALAWLMRTTGIVIDDTTSTGLTLTVAVIVISLYYALVRAVEQRFPAVGRFLLALGLTAQQPTYAPAVRASNDQTDRSYRGM